MAVGVMLWLICMRFSPFFLLFLSFSLPFPSSCQVDIYFISQEVFDRSFYKEMYQPAAPATTAQMKKKPSHTDKHEFLPKLWYIFLFKKKKNFFFLFWAAH